jgi:hypothetical protein
VSGWSTPFGRFVSEYGVPALARDLTARGAQVLPASIYKWVAGSTEPRPQMARMMRELSRGRLSFDAIYMHRAAANGNGHGNAPSFPALGQSHQR